MNTNLELEYKYNNISTIFQIDIIERWNINEWMNITQPNSYWLDNPILLYTEPYNWYDDV